MKPVFSALLIAASLAACTDEPELASSESALSATFQREHVTGDIYHYVARITVGSGPNAAIRVHRVVRELAPYVPKPTHHAAMLLHGDFANFVTNFAPTLGVPASTAPGLAPYLAAHDVDVWGVDRRWTLPGETDSISDFATMGIVQELSDLRAALVLARTVRGSTDKLALIGFSHGGELAYAYAASEGPIKNISALAVIDFLGDYGPEAQDLRQATCANAATEYELVTEGTTDSPNDFFVEAGELAITAPNAMSPFEDKTNQQVVWEVAGQTYEFAPITPAYHLLAPRLDRTGDAIGLRLTTDSAANTWFAGAPPHESMLEAADFDAYLCGDAPPIDAPLSNIHVPLYYLGEAGGVGAYGVHTTTQVSSTDVTVRVLQQLPANQQLSDVGHGDALFASSAPSLAWQPLLAWLQAH